MPSCEDEAMEGTDIAERLRELQLLQTSTLLHLRP